MSSESDPGKHPKGCIRDRQKRERLELRSAGPADAIEKRRERWRAKSAVIAQEVRDGEYFIRCLRECLGLAPYGYYRNQ